MGRPKQNLPRTFREPQGAQAAARANRRPTRLWRAVGLTGALAAVAIAAAIALSNPTSSQTADDQRIAHNIATLLAGIPQQAATLGDPAAPMRVEAFLDLKDPDSRKWFLSYLPAIIHDYIRPGRLKIEYHAFKTNTYDPKEFVRQQTAALAAGAQHKLWNFIEISYHEQGSEFATYATESYLDHIADQVPGLDLTQFRQAQHAGRREEQTTQEDQTARNLHLHVTPSFRIGPASGTMHNFTGHATIKHGEQHPISLLNTQDLRQAIKGTPRTRRH
jgi:protein-disulfide isomerase